MKKNYIPLLAVFLLLSACNQNNKDDANTSKSNENRWVSGWGQGTSEYSVTNGVGNQIYIACNESSPASVTVEIMGKKANPASGEETVFIIDSVPYPYLHENAGCRVCGPNFEFFWDKLRNAKTLAVKFSDTKISSFTTNKLRETLPELKSSSCRVADF
jgi:hypothetical protein